MSESTSGHAAHMKRAENLGIHAQVRRPLKVVFLGAGSAFVQPLFTDVLNIPGADRGEFVLVDIDEGRLDLSRRLAEKMTDTMGKDWRIGATTDRREALPNADYVINCIEVNGTACVRPDYDIPKRYGVDQCIGDTIGPGGLFKAMRTVPTFIEVLRDMEELCPQAWMLNYTNPMNILCLAAHRAGAEKVVGLCHSVQGTSKLLSEYAGVPYAEMVWECAGINHLAWFTRLEYEGRDLYPELIQKIDVDKELYEKDPVRFDMMRHFGHFITESSGHLSEYLPFYRKRSELIDQYCHEGYLGGRGFYADNWPTWRKNQDEHREKVLAGEVELGTGRSWEYASFIIEAMETHQPFVIYGNVPNTGGLISNLPHDGVVEVACVVDRRGIKPTSSGALPSQCAAICDWNMRMFDLAADACIERSLDKARMALMLDPLTAAVCSPAEISSMFDEMVEAERPYLPGFE